MARKRSKRYVRPARKLKKSHKRRSRKIHVRKGKINPWLKGAIAAVLPSAIAVGIGGVKKLLRTNHGYSDIYA